MSQFEEENDSNQSVKLTELKSYRQSQNISVQEIADCIKVNRNIVELIEQQRFSEIGAHTFVKGYLNNYCKYIGLSPKSIITQLPEEYHSSTSLVIPDALMPKPMSRVRRHSGSIGKYSVGTFLLALLITSIWFIWDKWKIEQPETIDINAVEMVSASDNQGDDDANVRDENLNTPFIYSSLLPQAKKNSIRINDPINKPVDSAVVSIGDASNVSVMSEVVNQGDDHDPGTVVVEKIDVDGSEPDDDSESENTIELILTEASWVSIKKHDGENIEYNMVQPGTHRYQYQSNRDSKLHIRIGNAMATQIKINDEPIDLGLFLRKNIADFNWPITGAEG